MISSLEALRKLTKSHNKSSDPLENFQKYLESKSTPDQKPAPMKLLKRGASLGKMIQTITFFYKRLQENYLKIWKFETIREELEYDKDYINSQVSYVLTYTFEKIHISRLRIAAKAWIRWKSLKDRGSKVEIFITLDRLCWNFKLKQFTKLKTHTLTRKSLKSLKLTLVFSRLRKIVKSKLETWKRRTEKAGKIEKIFQNFQEISFSQSRSSVFLSFLRKKLFFTLFRTFWTLLSFPGVKSEVFPSSLPKKSEKLSVKKLKKQKERHLDSVSEANIKLQLVDLMISLLSKSNSL
jgi:hypothetical protein